MNVYYVRSSVTTSIAGAALTLLSAGCPWLDDYPSWPTEPGPAAGSGAPSIPEGPLTEPILPRPPKNECPELVTGDTQFLNIPFRIWRGEQSVPDGSAPLLVYWHGTGSSPSEVETFLGPVLDEVLAAGGIVAAPAATSFIGDITSTGTWYTGDAEVIDELVACVVRQAKQIDVKQIYTAGCSSGGIQAAVFSNLRSGYVAASALNSGGQVAPFALDVPQHQPPTIAAHGAAGFDVVIVDFSETSRAYAQTVVANGGFATLCDHGGGHCGASPELVQAQWQFLKAHPFGVAPEPYADGLPGDFPDYCSVVTQ
ncbi:MAG: hypothetical protein ABW321_25325 [Polyangiales bacterium]